MLASAMRRSRARTYEGIVVQHQSIALFRAQRAKDAAGLAEARPAHWPHDRLHVGDRLDLSRIAGRAMESERRAPIVHDENDVPCEA
jgi:hypothetical protein